MSFQRLVPVLTQ